MCKEDAKNVTDTGCDEYRGQRNASLLERNRASLEVNVGVSRGGVGKQQHNGRKV